MVIASQTNSCQTHLAGRVFLNRNADPASSGAWHALRMWHLVTIDRGVCMRVAGRTLVFGVLIYGLLASTASASPILGADSIGCTAVLTAPTTNCALLGIDPFAPGTISGEFEFLNDVALFSFTLTGDTMFSAHTTSFATTGFDSTFALFNAGGTRSMVAFPDGSQYAHSADINA